MRLDAATDSPGLDRVPSATYRLQFNRDCTLAQAHALVAYLHDLGVSHIYASSYLKARAGSLHGYDIVDHCELNPELGDAAAFQNLRSALAMTVKSRSIKRRLHAFGRRAVMRLAAEPPVRDLFENHSGGRQALALDVLRRVP